MFGGRACIYIWLQILESYAPMFCSSAHQQGMVLGVHICLDSNLFSYWIRSKFLCILILGMLLRLSTMSVSGRFTCTLRQAQAAHAINVTSVH